eukprot:3936512-Rhodomonas_salina.1
MSQSADGTLHLGGRECWECSGACCCHRGWRRVGDDLPTRSEVEAETALLMSGFVQVPGYPGIVTGLSRLVPS